MYLLYTGSEVVLDKAQLGPEIKAAVMGMVREVC